MKKLSTLIVLGLIAFAPLGNSAGLPSSINGLIEKYSRNLPASKALKASPDQCSDFSGQWEGDCTGPNGQTSHMGLNMKQDGCQSVKLDGESLSMRNNLVLATNNEKGQFVGLDWSGRFADGGRSLLGQVGFSVSTAELAAPLGGRISFDAQREEDTIHVKGLVHVWLALQDVAKEEFECTLHKM